VLDETRHIYYTSSWQAIEERLGTDPDSSDASQQYVWGIRYIDDLVLRDRDTSEPSDGTLNEQLYAIQDPNWNVTTIIDDSGDVQERYEYEAYGTVAFLNSSFIGIIGSLYQWGIMFGSIASDFETLLYNTRLRLRSSMLGEWMTRDRSLYADGYNLYQSFLSNPSNFDDPLGLASGSMTILGSKYISFPAAAIVSYVGAINLSTDIDANDLFDLHLKATKENIKAGQSTIIMTAFGFLGETANPVPPNSFSSNADWEKFVASKEYRGYEYLIPVLCCDKNGIRNWSVPKSEDSQGFTPDRSEGHTLRYSAGEGSAVLTSSLRGSNCIVHEYYNFFRVGWIGQAVAGRVFGNIGIPYAWEHISYATCCDGSYSIRFRGSDFPSHNVYVDWSLSGNHKQKDILRFTYSGNKIPARGTWKLTASGKVP